MKAVINLDVPEWQIGQPVSVYFPDTMMKKGVCELLKEQPKNGTWIEKEDYYGDTYYDCSVCDESWTTIEGTPWQNGMNYCPHCGAKMEVKRE